MNVTEAITALKNKKAVECAETGQTMTCFEDEGTLKVLAIRPAETELDKPEKSHLSLSRMAMLHKQHNFKEVPVPAVDKSAK